MLFGPLVGSLLYMAGGFKMPFYVVGALLLIAVFVLGKVLPHESEQEIQIRADTSHEIEV